MKKLIAALALAAGSTAWAGQVTGDVSVNITFTPACQLSFTTAQVINATYTAYANQQAAVPAVVQLTCSDNLTPSVAIRPKGSTGAGSPANGNGYVVTDDVLQLNYSVGIRFIGSARYAVDITPLNGGRCGPGESSCSNTGATNNVHEVLVTF